MNDKLRECGCGHMSIICHKGNGNNRLHWIQCECGMKTGYFRSEEEMIRVWNRWNTRHQPTHETVEQWESRTGETYPDDKDVLVYSLVVSKWIITDYLEALHGQATVIYVYHHGKPEKESE